MRLLMWCLLCATAVSIAVSTAAGQDGDKLLGRVVAGNPRQYEPGRWGAVVVSLTNNEDTPREVELVVSFNTAPEREFSRRLWVPAGAVRRGWLPVQAPPKPPPGNRVWRLKCRFFDTTHGERKLLRIASSDALFEETLLTPMKIPRPTALMSSQRGAALDDIQQGIVSARQIASLSDHLLGASRTPPAWSHWLDSIDVLVLSRDIKDAGALAAVRHWVRGGGRLWIMLDVVSEETVAALLGDAAPLTIVGRETQTQLTFRNTNGSEETFEFDDPVELCMLAEPPGELVCEANGWAAATKLRLGDGDVILTTVELRAWRRGEAIRWLSQSVYSTFAPESWPAAEAERLLHEQVAQGVPSRRVVMLVMGALTAALVGGGALLFRMGVPERLVWLAPVASLIAAGLLVAVGAAARSEAPSTLASIQWAEAFPGTDELSLRGSAVAYLPEMSERPLSGRGTLVQGRAVPSNTMLTSEGDWRWRQADLPPGAHVFRFDGAAPAPLRAQAWFDEHGLQGRLHGIEPGAAGDAVVAVKGRPSIAVQWGADGRFTASASGTLSAAQHVPAKLVTDSGRRRQQFLEAFWEDGQRPRNYEPHLLFWTEPWEARVQWPPSERVVGDALTSVPLQLRPCSSGQRVTVPGSLIGLTAKSAIYSNRLRRWTGSLNRGSQTPLEFRLPEAVLPLKVERAELVCKIDAPGRQFRVRDRQGRELEAFSGPMGVRRIKLDGESCPADAEGRIRLMLEVGDEDGVSADARWSVGYVLLHVSGVVQ